MSRISNFLSTIESDGHRYRFELPSRTEALSFVDDLFEFLFPIASCSANTANLPDIGLRFKQLQLRFQALLCPLRAHITQPIELVNDIYFNELPTVYQLLRKDADAILTFDPAAFCIEEIISTYPGFFATYVYRVSHQLYKLNVPILPRMWSEYAHSKTGIDIHPGAQIGESFFMDHGTGIVIGETCTIGKNVKIYQGVTLGAINVEKSLASTKRHPTIEDNVVIYSGTTILGGETIIGHDSIIGGNVWLTETVKPYSVVYHKSEVRVRKSKNSPIDPNDENFEPINFVI